MYMNTSHENVIFWESQPIDWESQPIDPFFPLISSWIENSQFFAEQSMFETIAKTRPEGDRRRKINASVTLNRSFRDDV